MKHIKLNLNRTRIPLKIQKAKNIVVKMTGNTNFTTPAPSLASITTAINKLESSYELAIDGGKSKKAAMRIDEASLDALLTQLAAYVQDITVGDELKILSSGMELKSSPVASQIPEIPGDIQVVLKRNEGEVSLKWKAVKRVAAYLLQINDKHDNENTWTLYDACTKASYTGGEFESSSIKWFRIAALGAKGKSLWSQPVKVTIL